MRNPSKWAIGAAAFLLWGVVVVHWAPSPWSAAAVQSELQDAVEQSLKIEGATWARPRADGQVVELFGKAPGAIARRDAVIASIKAAGPGGAVFGGVTRVKVAAVEMPDDAERRPFNWSVARAPDRITMAGQAPPGEGPRRDVMRRAKALFSAPIVDQSTVSSAAPEDWGLAAQTAVEALAELKTGRVALEGREIALTGVAVSQSGLDAARRRLAALSDLTLASDDVTVERSAPPVANEPEQAPESVDACARAFETLISDGGLQFEVASAELLDNSGPLLERIAETARGCSDYRIVVEGHTDSQGDAEMNMELSIARAETVADSLIGRGVARDRIAVEGFGETAPIAPNGTAEGRAANRRIAFRVEQ